MPVDINAHSRALFEKKLITESQLRQVQEYRGQGLFSLRNEIRFLLFLGLSLFTSGSGIIIYNNINSLGHIALLAVLLAVTIACFYFSFRRAPGYSRHKLTSDTILHDYLVLLANILSGIFIGYLQYQYRAFGAYNELATLLPTALYFFSAYYFDHKGVLSLGITGLCAFLGFSASPSGLLHNEFSENSVVGYYAIALSAALILWAHYSIRQDLKSHFATTFRQFALHVASVACISLLFYGFWFIPFLLLSGTVYYYSTLAYAEKTLSFFVFAFIYGFIGLTIALGRLIFSLNENSLLAFIYLSPFYFGGAIVLLIQRLRHLRNYIKNDSIQ